MIDHEIVIDTRECTECKHYLGGCKCRAFDKIPLDVFVNASQHDKQIPGQTGSYTFETDIPAVKSRVYIPS